MSGMIQAASHTQYKIKRCPRCTLVLPSSKFHFNRKVKSGLATYCKECDNAKRREDRMNGGYCSERSIKIKVIRHYSGGKMCCARCKFSDIRTLTLDHINGGGNKHRSELGGCKSVYRSLVKNNFPSGYQILCMNCQFIKRVEQNECGKNKQ